MDTSITKKLFYTSLPIILVNALEFLFVMMDSFLVAGLGESAISVVEISSQIYFCLNYIVLGVVSSNNMFLSRFNFEKRYENEICLVIGYSLKIIIGISLFFSVVAFFFPSYIYYLYTDEKVIIELGNSYLPIYSLSWIFLSITSLMIGILRCNYKNRIILVISIIIPILKFVLSKMLFTYIGINGIALATLITRLLELYIYIIMIMKNKQKLSLQMKKILVNKKIYNISYKKHTIPLIINEVAWSMGLSVINILIAKRGVAVIVAYSIYNMARKISGFFGQAMITATSVIMGNLIGMGNDEIIRLFTNKILKVTKLISLFTGVTTIVVGFTILKFYTIDNITLNYTYQFIFIGFIIESFRIMASMNMMGILRAGGDSRFVLINDIAYIWLIEIPLGFLLWANSNISMGVFFFILHIEHILKYVVSFFRIMSNRWIKSLR